LFISYLSKDFILLYFISLLACMYCAALFTWPWCTASMEQANSLL